MNVAKSHLRAMLAYALLMILMILLVLVGAQIGKSASVFEARNFRETEAAYPLCLLDPLCVAPTWNGRYSPSVGSGLGWFSPNNGAQLADINIADLAWINYTCLMVLVTLTVVACQLVGIRYRKRLMALLGLVLLSCALGWMTFLSHHNPQYPFANFAEVAFVAVTILLPYLVAWAVCAVAHSWVTQRRKRLRFA